MTVKELREKIAGLPDEMDVFIAERGTEFDYGPVNSVYEKEIIFYEQGNESDEVFQAKDTVLIIDEEYPI